MWNLISDHIQKSKMITELNVGTTIIKSLKDNLEKYFNDIEFGKDYLNRPQRT